MLYIVITHVKHCMERAMDFFEDSENKHCWGQCSVDNECEGLAKPVLVFSDGSKGLWIAVPTECRSSIATRR